MNDNILQILQSGNPQALIMNMLQSRANGNPMLMNVLQMMQSGNSSGIENVARNLCRERGVNPEQVINSIKQQYSR